MLVKTDNPAYAKDTHSKAVVTVDDVGLRGYRMRRAALAAQDSRLSKVEADLVDIKEMLQQLVRRL